MNRKRVERLMRVHGIAGIHKRRRRSRPQHPTPQNPRLANPSRSPQPTTTLSPTQKRCDDRLNPPGSRAKLCASTTGGELQNLLKLGSIHLYCMALRDNYGLP